eukprot:6894399-Prymnesium_polylepis.1
MHRGSCFNVCSRPCAFQSASISETLQLVRSARMYSDRVLPRRKYGAISRISSPDMPVTRCIANASEN